MKRPLAEPSSARREAGAAWREPAARGGQPWRYTQAAMLDKPSSWHEAQLLPVA